jgi:hypothetical protein
VYLFWSANAYLPPGASVGTFFYLAVDKIVYPAVEVIFYLAVGEFAMMRTLCGVEFASFFTFELVVVCVSCFGRGVYLF